MIGLVGLSFIVQILAILHVIRTGRNQIWIWIILLGSMLGCTAYFAFELMPELFGPGSRYARQKRTARDADPVLRLREAERALEMVDTAANRVAMGDAQMMLGANGEAILQYRTALGRMNGADAKIETKLAHALFENGEFGAALAAVDRITEPAPVGDADRLKFLRARILAELGRHDEAAALYADIVTRLPGEEALCRYAALLIEMGRNADALEPLEAVERLIKQRPLVDGDPAMIEWAKSQLHMLRRQLSN
jgi:hypothetical protein